MIDFLWRYVWSAFFWKDFCFEFAMHRSIYILLFLLASCTGTQQTENEISDSSDSVIQDDTSSLSVPELPKTKLITCNGIGNISLSDNMEDLIKKAGSENIYADSLFLEGSFEGIISTLWNNTENEIAVRWTEKQEPYRTIKFLEIKQGAIYKFSNGIGVGSSLSEIADLNGAPFNLYGFAWDYGGTFIDFDGGKLSAEIPCFGGVFTLQKAGSKALDPGIMGDKKINSDHSALQEYNPRLSVIRISRKN